MISFKQQIRTIVQTEALSLKLFCISLLYILFSDENSNPTGFLLRIERSTVICSTPLPYTTGSDLKSFILEGFAR